MTSDWDLLRQFARENSQDAFGEIVRRHLDLVYSAALRQVRSPELAEEVARSVFTDLARDAGKLKADTILTAWLYAVTRRTAVDVVRKESRRQLREQIATEMNTTNDISHFAKCEMGPAWAEIEPLLEDAMAALDETDRSAVLLRFFENKSLREVGVALGASEDAAQKRVSRAVERLREFFSKRNATIGASGLVVLISANAVQSAPVGLVVTISAATLAGTAAASSAAFATTKVIAMTTLQRIVIGATLTAAVGTGIFEAHQASQLRDRVQTLQKQQSSLAEQLRQLERERGDATIRLTALRNENERLKNSEAELLKSRVQNLASVGVTPPSPDTSAPTNIKPDNRVLPKNSWSNAGFATPEAALKTRGWAVLNGGRARFAESLSITPGARKRIEDRLVQMAAASNDPDRDKLIQEALQNQWGAEEAILMPMMALNEQKGFTGYRVLSQQSPAADGTILGVETEMASGPPQNETLKFQRFGNDWKMVVDEDAIKSAH